MVWKNSKLDVCLDFASVPKMSIKNCTCVMLYFPNDIKDKYFFSYYNYIFNI